MEKTLLSLFDYSGHWAEPFWRNGWNVIQMDLKHGQDLNDFKSIEDVWDWGISDVNGIIAAPPCTDFTVSGAQYWDKKDAAGQTEESLQLVYQVQKFANLFMPTDPDYDEPFFWAMENPVGRLPKLIPEIGKPYYFDPYEFAGYNAITEKDVAKLEKIRAKNGQGITKKEFEFVMECEAYTKKTGLWGVFNKDLIKKPVQPVKCAPQGSFTQRFGGKGDKTKEARSFTPFGFAEAFYQANHDWTGYLDTYYLSRYDSDELKDLLNKK